MTRRILLVISLCALAAPASPPQTRDYPGMKRQMQLFETLLTAAVKQRYGHPFGILQQAKGTYLDGFGAVFTIEVNTYQIRVRNPWDNKPYTEKELNEARSQKLAAMKEAESLIQGLLHDPGPGLNFLRPDESVAVVLHLYNPAELSDLPSQIVIQAKRQALIDAAGQRLTAAEFRNKLTVVSF